MQGARYRITAAESGIARVIVEEDLARRAESKRGRAHWLRWCENSTVVRSVVLGRMEGGGGWSARSRISTAGGPTVEVEMVVLGATGSLGRHVLGQALAAGHQVTVLVRTPAKLPLEVGQLISIHTGDLNAPCAARSGRARRRTRRVDQLRRSRHRRQRLGRPDRPPRHERGIAAPAAAGSWFLAGAALLDVGASGRRGVELPKVKSTYWPHRINFERLGRSPLDWRLPCPGPMVEQPALGLDRLRISLGYAARSGARARGAPASAVACPALRIIVPQMIVPYADAAALMLANIDRAAK